MFTRGMPSLVQTFCNIWPKFDAAAVCASAVWPSKRIVPIMPSTVSGLTKHDAPSAGVVPSCRTRHWSARLTLNCEYMAPPKVATVLPRRACSGGIVAGADHDARALVAAGNDRPMRGPIIARASGGISARTPPSIASARAMSAPLKSRPRSDGLIGAASTRISTSAGPGTGSATSATVSSTCPPARTVDCICFICVVPHAPQ